MQRYLSIIVVSLVSLVLCACEQGRELWADWGDEQQTPEETPSTPIAPSIERAQQVYALGGGLMAVASVRGPQIIDIRDQTGPRFVSEYRLTAWDTRAFYRVGDRLLVITEDPARYDGARTDVIAIREHQLAVLNIDIRNRSHPVLLDRLVLSGFVFSDSLLRRSGEGAELYVMTQSGDSPPPGDGLLESLQLRDGRLSMDEPQQVPLEHVRDNYIGLRAVDPTWLVLEVKQTENTLEVWRIDSGRAIRQPSISIHGTIYWAAEQRIANGLLRLSYTKHVPYNQFDVIESFMLGEEPAAHGGSVVSGVCRMPETYSHWAGPHYLSDDLVMIWSGQAGGVDTLRFRFDAQGNCQPVAETADCPSTPPTKAFDLLATANDAPSLVIEQHSGELESDRLSLYDTAPQACLSPVASIELGTRTFADRSAQLGPVAATASDGSLETSLLVLACENNFGSEECFQLVTYSDHTATRRAKIVVPDPGLGAVFGPHGRLALATTKAVKTYDVRQPDQVRELGSLPLVMEYQAFFGFGEYVARIRADRSGSSAPDQLEVLPLTAAGERDPVVARALSTGQSQWYQVGELVVEREFQNPPRSVFQIYDLSDPPHPRRVGQLLNMDVAVGSNPSNGYLDQGRALGSALVYRHASPEGALTFDVIDLRSPAAPTLVRPAFAVEKPKPGSQRVTEVAAGTKLYESVVLPLEAGASRPKYATSFIDFADPQAPERGPTIELPAPLRLVIGDDLYTQTMVDEPAVLTRVTGVMPTESQASMSLPGFLGAPEIATDGAGHLFTLNRQSPQPSGGHPGWTYLHVLDDETLQVLATLPIDLYVSNPRFSRGHLLVDGSGVAYVIDVRDPVRPRVQGYVPVERTTTIVADQVFSVGDVGFQVFDAAALENL